MVLAAFEDAPFEERLATGVHQTLFLGCLMTRGLAAVLVFSGALLISPSFVYAQQNSDDGAQPLPAITVPGDDLIGWSAMQNPQPMPQTPGQPTPAPEPKPETPAPQNQPPSEAQPGQSPKAQTAAQGETPEPAAETFTGTITKEGNSYVLKVSDTSSYQLDDQDQAKSFDGQKVRVIGAVDASSNLIHVQKIEPLS